MYIGEENLRVCLRDLPFSATLENRQVLVRAGLFTNGKVTEFNIVPASRLLSQQNILKHKTL